MEEEKLKTESGSIPEQEITGESAEPEKPEVPGSGDNQAEEVERLKAEISDLLKESGIDAEIAGDVPFLKAVRSSLSQMIHIQKRLYEVVEEFPQFGDALDGILKGMDPVEAIARYFDIESLTPPEDAPDFERINTAKSERRQKIDTMNAKKKQLEENQQVSIDNVRKFMDKKGWDQEKAISFLNEIEALQTDMFDGKLSENHLDILEKGFGYDEMIVQKDSEIEAAAEDGRIAGLNEQIEQKRAKKETGDGIPKLPNSGSISPNPTSMKKLSMRKEFRV